MRRFRPDPMMAAAVAAAVYMAYRRVPLDYASYALLVGSTAAMDTGGAS